MEVAGEADNLRLVPGIASKVLGVDSVDAEVDLRRNLVRASDYLAVESTCLSFGMFLQKIMCSVS